MGGCDGDHNISWISWSKITRDKPEGGLGLASFKAKNLTLISKWFWRFISNENNIWKDVIIELYGAKGGFDNPNLKNGKSGWESIVAWCRNFNDMAINFQSSFSKSIANGSSVKFWVDEAVGPGERLKDKFPRLYALERNKEVEFKDRWFFHNGYWQGA